MATLGDFVDLLIHKKQHRPTWNRAIRAYYPDGNDLMDMFASVTYKARMEPDNESVQTKMAHLQGDIDGAILWLRQQPLATLVLNKDFDKGRVEQ